jgi:ribonuclease HI
MAHIASLQKVLNQQARAATGCFRTTPISFLMAEGGSQPAEAIIRGQEARFHARILGRPLPRAPIHESKVSTTANAVGRLYKRSVERTGLDEIETVQPRYSDKTSGAIIIESTAVAEATAQQWRALNAECFWTDGSQLPGGHTGAAVVWQAQGEFQAEEFYLGTNKEVFDAEVYAIYRALHHAQRLHDSGHTLTKVAIFSDAQAALLRLHNDNEGPGQLLAQRTFFVEKALQRHGIMIEYRWLPSHIGIPSNEAADAAAKRAASHWCDDSEDCQKRNCHAIRWASLAHINRQATETQSRLTQEWIQKQLSGSRSCKPKKKWGIRKSLQKIPKCCAAVFLQLASSHALIGTHLM